MHLHSSCFFRFHVLSIFGLRKQRKIIEMLYPPLETSVFSRQARINKWLPWQRPSVILPVFPLVWLALNPFFISFYLFIHSLIYFYTFLTSISFSFFDWFKHTWRFWSSAFALRVSPNIDVMLGSCCLALFMPSRSDLICGVKFTLRGRCFDFILRGLCILV